MDFFDVLEQRRSIRAFKDQRMEPDKLKQILEAINRAPSAGNLQSYEVYLVTEAAHRTALARPNQDFVKQAPVALVFCAHAQRAEQEYGIRGTGLYCVQDAAIACTFAMLAATALGLSSVWVGAFDEDHVRGVIHAPRDHQPVSVLAIGYAAESPSAVSRRSLSDLVHQVQ